MGCSKVNWVMKIFRLNTLDQISFLLLIFVIIPALEDDKDGDLRESPAMHFAAEEQGHGGEEGVVSRGEGQQAGRVVDNAAGPQLTAYSQARAAKGAHCC